MVTIIVGDVYSKLNGCPPHLLVKVRSLAKARPEGYQHMPKYRNGQWDGYISLMHGMYHVPTGLLRDVVDLLYSANVKIVYNYDNIRRVNAMQVHKDMLHGIVMRDYQVDATRTLLSRERGVARMATNSGKTVVIAALIKCLVNKNALVVVNSKELLYQTSNKLRNMLGREVGLIGDGHRSSSDVCVATIQTLSSLEKQSDWTKRFASNVVLIVDECHHVSGNRTFDVLMKIPGWYRFGLSGTPLQSQALRDLKLIAATGPVCVNISNNYLIKHEWSATPTIHIIDVGTDDNDYWELSYPNAYDACIVNNDFRNKTIVNIAMQEKDSSVLVIVDRIKHGLMLQEMIPGSCFLCGQSDIELRMATLAKLARGGGQVVIATNIFDEGVDVPALDVIILAGGGKSYVRLLQRLGRGLRKKEGNNRLTVYDFWDDTNKYLIAHSERRYDTYIEEGFEVIFDHK